MSYTWDTTTHTWRDASGNIVPWEVVLLAMWRLIGEAEDLALELVEQLMAGEISVEAWEMEFQLLLAGLYGDLFILGTGGTLMAADDMQPLVALMTQQFNYIRDILVPMLEADASAAMLAYRSDNFLRSAQQAFWAAWERAAGITLPAHPGDCSTVCCTNCHCWWRVEWDGEGWVAYWELLSGLENCPDCEERGQMWYPWVPPGGG